MDRDRALVHPPPPGVDRSISLESREADGKHGGSLWKSLVTYLDHGRGGVLSGDPG